MNLNQYTTQINTFKNEVDFPSFGSLDEDHMKVKGDDKNLKGRGFDAVTTSN